MTDAPHSSTGSARFTLGEWLVEPDLNRLSRDDSVVTLDNKTMDVLALLAARGGDVVSNDDVIDAVWGGRPMGENPVYKCIGNIRKALGDDPKSPSYVETIAGRGYRLLVPVEYVGTESEASCDDAVPPPRPMKLALFVLLVVVAGIWWWPGTEPAPEANASTYSIAVVPFANLSGDESNDFFCQGMADVLLNQLATQTNLRVIARTSSFSEGSKIEDTGAFMQRLNVSNLLSGSVQQHDDTLRVSARLTDINGNVVWSQTFDRNRQDIFQLQNDIAAAVVDGVNPEASSSLATHAPPTDNIEAYEAYILGREYLHSRAGLDWSSLSKEAFEKAIRLDPEFAEAYAGIGVLSLISASSVRSGPVAEWSIGEAMRLNPNSPESLAAAGLLAAESATETGYRESVDLLRRSLALNPSDINVYNWLSISLQVLGEDAESAEVLESALELDPLNPLLILNYARRLISAGEYDRARERTEFVFQLPNVPSYAVSWLADIDVMLGDYEAALNVYKREDAKGNLPWEPWFFYAPAIAGLYERLGIRDRAVAWGQIARFKTSSSLWLGDKYQYFIIQGRHEELEQAIDDFLAAQSEGEVLNLHARTLIGSAAVHRGDFQAAIEYLEPIYSEDWALSNQRGGSTVLLETMNYLAVALMESGRDADARQILETALEQHEEYEARGVVPNGNMLKRKAVSFSLLGRNDEALDTMQLAIDAGWAEYYPMQYDPTMDRIRQLPEFERMMESVKSAIDVQCARVEAEESLRPFNLPQGSM